MIFLFEVIREEYQENELTINNLTSFISTSSIIILISSFSTDLSASTTVPF